MHSSFRFTALFAALALSAHAQVTTILFSDNFSTTGQSDDVNSQYTAGRQSGTLGTFQYRQGNGAVGGTIAGTIANEGSNGFKTQIGNASGPGTLWLVGGNAANTIGSISPEQNFTANPGLGGYLSISFTVNPVTASAGTSADWAAITLGAADNASFGSSGSGARGQGIISSAAHFGILFRDNGGYQAFDGSANVSTGTYSSSPTTILTHSIELRVSGLGDGNPWDGSGDAQIGVYADGSLAYTFIKTGGYTNNYVTLQALGGSSGFSISQFDDLQIATVSAVPEPSSYALAAGGAMLLLTLARRRARR
jgi:hypothetical protein